MGAESKFTKFKGSFFSLLLLSALLAPAVLLASHEYDGAIASHPACEDFLSPGLDRHVYEILENLPKFYRLDPRFMELARDPANATRDSQTGTLIFNIEGKHFRETMAILEAERRGHVVHPRRGSREMDYLGDGPIAGEVYSYDIKSPVSPSPGANWRFEAKIAGESILGFIRKHEALKAGAIFVILDSSYMNVVDREALWSYLRANATPGELDVVLEIVIQMASLLRLNLLSLSQLNQLA